MTRGQRRGERGMTRAQMAREKRGCLGRFAFGVSLHFLATP